jgi:beta-1,4-mannosyl-glycoprotein beta-1,4-N-acetylglucosaminyltransferase
MVFDCFPFFNELDLLEVRFMELDAVVDKFVLVESTVTFAGCPKPLYFADSQSRFLDWRHKIVHVVASDMPLGDDHWAREHYQRNVIIRGLRDATSADAVIISDADEIPSARAIRRWTPDQGPRRFDQLFSYYWVNCVAKGDWGFSKIISMRDFSRLPDATAIRGTNYPSLDQGGWHFSFLGDVRRIVTKLEAWAHQETNRTPFKIPRYLRIVRASGIDLFVRPEMSWEFVPFDERFPVAMIANRERFDPFICDARFNDSLCSANDIFWLITAYERTRGLNGTNLEFGCWEGRSTVALANACFPEPLIAVDTWRSNGVKNSNHIPAGTWDVYEQFERNVKAVTSGNVQVERTDTSDFLCQWDAPIKFAHIGTSHSHKNVRLAIQQIIPKLVPGGVLLGHNYSTSEGIEDREAGIERAVSELLPGLESRGDCWFWQRR